MRRVRSRLSVAISKAVQEAELRRLEMSLSLEWGRIAQLLRAQADNARISPLGYDQLLAIALDAAACPGEFHAPALEALGEPADPVAQLQLRHEVFTQYDAAAAAAVAKAAPDWVLRRAAGQGRRDPRLLAGWLDGAADLNTDLWDHPALPASPGFRGLMLACVGGLRERAGLMARTKTRRHRRAPSHHVAQGAMA